MKLRSLCKCRCHVPGSIVIHMVACCYESIDEMIAQTVAERPTVKHDAPKTNSVAPSGQRWRCCACGKISLDYLDWKGGWDESCAVTRILEPIPT